MKYPALHFAAYVVAFAFSIFGFLSTCAPNNGYGQTVQTCDPDNRNPVHICKPEDVRVDGKGGSGDSTWYTHGQLPIGGTTSASQIVPTEDHSWRVEAVDERYAIVNISNLTSTECVKLAAQMDGARICDLVGGGSGCRPYRMVVCVK